jgi:uracil-DNA glycosylase family 4
MKQDVLNNLFAPCRLIHKNNPYYLEGATQFVAGYGNIDSKIIFIGEAPGTEEDQTGIPFQGRSGKLLHLYLKKYNFTERNTYITNVVKFRPCNNRKPTCDEITLHGQILMQEIAIIEPKIIVTVGSTATAFMLQNKSASMTKLHGHIIHKSSYLVIPIFHPAYVLRKRIIEAQFESDIKNILTLFQTIK